MKILLLSFYYPPDLSAGSFRMAALVEALLECLPQDVEIELLTTQPNRYASVSAYAPLKEHHGRLTIHRIPLSPHRGGFVDQSRAFLSYARGVERIIRGQRYDLVVATSSRLMTASLGACVATLKRAPLYLDLRDIFVDTIADVFPRWLAALAVGPMSLVEWLTVGRAQVINLVSGGFRSYFESRYPRKLLTFHTNGIDEEFIGIEVAANPEQAKITTVLYAGNIGDGQGLHLILPSLALRTTKTMKYRIFGDGGRLELLRLELKKNEIENIEILKPIRRDQLLSEYMQADILFLHLNDYDAFKKVLPSKLFEYGATGKPIWAGISGYAAEFAATELENIAIFEPCNADAAMAALQRLSLEMQSRKNFVEKFDRKIIMRRMAEDIATLLSAPQN